MTCFVSSIISLIRLYSEIELTRKNVSSTENEYIGGVREPQTSTVCAGLTLRELKTDITSGRLSCVVEKVLIEKFFGNDLVGWLGVIGGSTCPSAPFCSLVQG